MRVSVKELLRSFSLLSDKALHEPVIITKNGRDRLVLVSIEEYAMLRDMIGTPSAPDSVVNPENADLVPKAKRA